MTDHPDSRQSLGFDHEHAPGGASNTISPLPGEPGIPDVAARPTSTLSKKGLLAVGLLILSLVAVSAFSIQRFASSGKKADDGESKRISDRPTAASAEPRKLDMPTTPTVAVANAAHATAAPPRIPALLPTAEESAEPIGVRRTGQGLSSPGSSSGGVKPSLPEDAPVLLVSTRPVTSALNQAALARRPDTSSTAAEQGQQADPADPLAATTRNLQDYQHQLQGLLADLTQRTAQATGQATGQTSGATPFGALPPSGSTAAGQPVAGAGGGLFGGQLQSSATPRVVASMLGNRSLILPKGTAFTCALKTKLISASSGLVGCLVQRHVFSDDGRVLLIERGSHMDGEYRIASVRPGTVRIPVLWTRIRTPNGVTVEIDSPGTGQLGESGIDGYVDNRWGERIGAAMLLSLIDDSVKLVIQNQASDTQANTVVLPSTTANTSKLAEKVLDSTINIPPLVYQNQGGIVGIYVARDVDFSSVYELKATAR
jgi:type IV secretion system protein VirB10